MFATGIIAKYKLVEHLNRNVTKSEIYKLCFVNSFLEKSIWSHRRWSKMELTGI